MRLESDLKNNYIVFLSNDYIGDIDYTSKGKIGLYLKKIIVILKKRYNLVLKGFYEVNVYINKKVGMFIEINKIGEYDFDTEEIDLKIVVHFDSDFYFKTDNYDVISKYKNIKFFEDSYYIDVDDIGDNEVIKIIEMGEFIYGKDSDEISSLSTLF